jgi:hypothetical protein
MYNSHLIKLGKYFVCSEYKNIVSKLGRKYSELQNKVIY